jgi:uncharacterized membrane protein YdbT with pleckstrin-like domain
MLAAFDRGAHEMGYVERVLQPNETVRFRTRVHWIIYLPGAIIVVVGIAVALAVGNFNPTPGDVPYLPSLIALAIGFAFGILSILGAWWRRWTTEIAVTNLRVIYKRGFLRRHTFEMNMNKIESVHVEQSVLGRLFDYGDIVVRGTGSSFEPLKMIDAPLQFRNHVTAE